MINFVYLVILLGSASVNAEMEITNKKDVIWVSSDAIKNANINVNDSVIKTAKSPEVGQLNLRSQAYGKPIEVYNRNEKKWVETQIIYFENITISSEQKRKMNTLSDCDVVSEIITQFEDSTKSADVYVDGTKYGRTDKNGMFKQKTGANCKGNQSEFSLRKSKCEVFKEKIEVSSSPFNYQKTKILECKN